MAHTEQREFCEKIKQKYPQSFKNKKVLDIGSLDINGSNKDLFENCNYIGLDVAEGKNVDTISVGHLFDAPNETFDTIISTEVFEHDMFYVKTITNVMRMLKPGGLFLFTCGSIGRPEHGTRRTGGFDAPLLIEISEEWADYYKNLSENDIRKITKFNDVFPEGYFEYRNTNMEIPGDLYFCGIKGGELTQSKSQSDIFVIDCWIDTDAKTENLINLIERLKIYKIPILLTGHYPVEPYIQKMGDYYLFTKDNPLLTHVEQSKYDINSVRWAIVGENRIENTREFHHDYSIWETMRNAFNFCKSIGKENIHFIEYDNLPDIQQYQQSFIENLHRSDAVIYEYHKGSTIDKNPYCSTYIFSIKTDVAIKTINTIKTKDEFFRHKTDRWQLEKNFFQTLQTITNNIHISEYIPNNNEFNMQVAWGNERASEPYVQYYLGIDPIDENSEAEIYLNLVSGTGENMSTEDYIIEVVYGKYKNFHILTKGETLLLHIGKYERGEEVKLYHQGIEFGSKILTDDVVEFRKFNKIINQKVTAHNPKEVMINFIDGPFVEIKDDNKRTYHIEFINMENGMVEYEQDLESNHWCRPSIKYYVPWMVKIKGIDNDYVFEHIFDITGRRVLISFESKALGDTLAWIPYIEKMRVEKKCDVICSTFHNKLFKSQYPNIKFVEPGSSMNDIYSLYRIGLFRDNYKIDLNKHTFDPRTVPLGKICTDILGLEYDELKPLLPVFTSEKKKVVSIAVHGAAQCKYWNNPKGWQDVVDYLNSKGYEVKLLSREDDGYMGNNNPKNVTRIRSGSIENIIKIIQESELFIGISSGLSWISWAVGTETILISGFTDVITEPMKGIRRIINKNVCNGCWNKYDFDGGDWNWCPVHKGTDNEFECSKSITSEQVIKEIKSALGD